MTRIALRRALTLALFFEPFSAQATAPPAAVTGGMPSTGEHLRFERAVHVRESYGGPACAVLDGSVYAHAATGQLDDLRLYALAGDGHWNDVPVFLRKSGTRLVDDDPAPVRNLGVHGGAITFDLQMPPRAYTAVRLELEARNFVGSAKVWGRGPGGHAKALGSFPVFDLSGAELSRSTVLPLQESADRELHVELRLHAAPGTVQRVAFPAAVVRGASVPPSREAQTLYTPVAEARRFEQRGSDTVAWLKLAAHVPAERIAFTIDPAFRGNFLRRVKVTARPDGRSDEAGVESLQGEISQVHSSSGTRSGQAPTDASQPGGPAGEPSPALPAPAGDQDAISEQEMHFPAVLGANLRDDATVEVDVANGTGVPLPLRSVQLQARQLQACFQAQPGATEYRLMYGGKPPPQPESATGTSLDGEPAVAVLGPEQANARFQPEPIARASPGRRTELLWAILALVFAVQLGVFVQEFRRRHGGSR